MGREEGAEEEGEEEEGTGVVSCFLAFLCLARMFMTDRSNRKKRRDRKGKGKERRRGSDGRFV